MRKQYNSMCRGNVRVIQSAHLEYEGGCFTLPMVLERSEVAWVVKLKGESVRHHLNDGRGRSSRKRDPCEKRQPRRTEPVLAGRQESSVGA